MDPSPALGLRKVLCNHRLFQMRNSFSLYLAIVSFIVDISRILNISRLSVIPVSLVSIHTAAGLSGLNSSFLILMVRILGLSSEILVC